jgi:hypothetical protein
VRKEQRQRQYLESQQQQHRSRQSWTKSIHWKSIYSSAIFEIVKDEFWVMSMIFWFSDEHWDNAILNLLEFVWTNWKCFMLLRLFMYPNQLLLIQCTALNVLTDTEFNYYKLDITKEASFVKAFNPSIVITEFWTRLSSTTFVKILIPSSVIRSINLM